RAGRMQAAHRRIARIDGARVAVVAVDRRAADADTRLAVLRAVAHGPVGTRETVRHVDGATAEARIATVGRADVVVVAVRRCPRRAAAADARLGAVADVAVAAGCAVP